MKALSTVLLWIFGIIAALLFVAAGAGIGADVVALINGKPATYPAWFVWLGAVTYLGFCCWLASGIVRQVKRERAR